MTGVGGRPELLIEVSSDNKNWSPVEFYYKPSHNLSVAPSFNIPH